MPLIDDQIERGRERSNQEGREKRVGVREEKL